MRGQKRCATEEDSEMMAVADVVDDDIGDNGTVSNSVAESTNDALKATMIQW